MDDLHKYISEISEEIQKTIKILFQLSIKLQEEGLVLVFQFEDKGKLFEVANPLYNKDGKGYMFTIEEATHMFVFARKRKLKWDL